MGFMSRGYGSFPGLSSFRALRALRAARTRCALFVALLLSFCDPLFPDCHWACPSARICSMLRPVFTEVEGSGRVQPSTASGSRFLIINHWPSPHFLVL